MPDNVTLDPPITNIERLLAKAAGMENVDVDDPETRIECYLKAICDRLDSGGTGGSQLPDPTENDVGKVATVVDNSGTYEYGLKTPSSSGGRFIITFTHDVEAETWSANKTLAECVAAFESGKTLWVKYNDGESDTYFPCSYFNPGWIQFASVDVESISIVGGFAIDADGAYYIGA